MTQVHPLPSPSPQGFSFKQVLVLLLGVILLTLLIVALVIKFWLYPQPFQPVHLSQKEQQGLEYKIEQLESSAQPSERTYSEQGLSREIRFTEREINSLLSPELSEKIVIAFDEDMISLRLLVPLDPDFPFMGGKTLRLRAGAELAYRQGRPVVILKGISLMGVPLPNAWLGGMKNVNLMEELDMNSGFWQSLAEGVEHMQVRRGELYIRLRE